MHRNPLLTRCNTKSGLSGTNVTTRFILIPGSSQGQRINLPYVKELMQEAIYDPVTLMNVNEHIVSLAPLELTWLSIQTQTTTLLPANQISLCLRRGNKRPISCPCASSDKRQGANQLSVWFCWGNEQPLSGLSGLHGVTAWPMSALSGCTEGVSVCRGPISGSVLPAGAGDWW